MAFRVLCMWALDVYSRDRRCMVMTLLQKARARRVATVAFVQHGVVDLEKQDPKRPSLQKE